jgi:hypothetical protein
MKIPIHRKNHRPVGLLQTLSKFLERLILNILHSHFQLLQFCESQQTGLCEHHPTNHQSYRIWHEGLELRLFSFKISRTIIYLRDSYLKNNLTFYISKNATNTAIHHILFGVPQGSVVFPAFLVYISGILHRPDTELT